MTSPKTPPNAFDHLDRIRSIVRTGRFGLFVDFDGTLSQIASTPEAARVSQRAAVALSRLVSQMSMVSVISGRTAHDIQKKVDIDGILYLGNHGAEYLVDNQLIVAPEVVEYVGLIDNALKHLRDTVQLPGIVWDYKKYSLAVHYRQTERPDQARLALQQAWDSSVITAGLDLFWGKMVMEIRPSVGIHKGYAIERLVEERLLDSVIMLGDDMTDIDGFRAIRGLRGLPGASILVLHDDTAEALMEPSDYSLAGVEGVERFLEWLVSVTTGVSHD